MRMGVRLIEAKGLVGHGRFATWVHDNCPFSHRTANNYMYLAESDLKSARVANLAEQGTVDAIELHLARKSAAQARSNGNRKKRPSDAPPSRSRRFNVSVNVNNSASLKTGCLTSNSTRRHNKTGQSNIRPKINPILPNCPDRKTPQGSRSSGNYPMRSSAASSSGCQTMAISPPSVPRRRRAGEVVWRCVIAGFTTPKVITRRIIALP